MKKILLALLTSCALVSCEGYFDQLPKTELPSETFYTSYDAALRNVAILYANAGHVNDGIMTSDRFMMPSLMNEGPFDLTSTSGSVLNLWSKHYAYIAQANLILERLETNKEVIDENAGHSALDKATITGSATEMLMGEVRFLRAYAYFTLYRYYGGVPLITRLARSVDHAAHNGYLHIKIHAGYHILYLICQVNEVDLGPSAGRTGNNFHAALPEP